ncbi:hypothetical protein SAMN04488540_102342 [Ferrimonas sediminum]|uniref:Phage shock protein B n=1 Tax=Ferrimonas sediminum TaxID=718193 RepID=A0A1G8MCR2_9GAMM|nr:hypothetical protein [Ferrimonas sediminum]SDI65733.1 hypothetical protein SAMN04488540_102342 [Ferrimonas sediminum]
MLTSGSIVAIVAIVMGCLVAMIKSKHRSDSKAHIDQFSQLEQELNATRERCRTLEERVVVLEKIVTDSGFDLRQEISRLG